MDPTPETTVTDAEPRASLTTSSPGVIAAITGLIVVLGLIALGRHTGWTTSGVLQAR